WLDLIFGRQLTKVEKVVCGKDAVRHLLQMNQIHYEPYVVYDGAIEKENTPATKNRLQDGKTLLYVCKDREPIPGWMSDMVDDIFCNYFMG
ncbi:MAG: hypothetical protein ACKPB3_05265, partial [Bacteroidota bacterium]